jgi:tetratricopeptide (TPR) repeat protein
MDLLTLARRARTALDRGRPEEAIQYYRRVCSETHTIEEEYNRWLRGFAEAHARLGHVRHASYIYLYLHEFAHALQPLTDEGESAGDRALILLQQERFEEAGQVYQRLEQFVSAAIAYERSAAAQRGDAVCTSCSRTNAGDVATCLGCGSPLPFDAAGARDSLGRARACWESLIGRPSLAGRIYERALGAFNLGFCCLKLGDAAGQAQIVMSQRLLEEAADQLETEGLRERAFDCYQILLEIGRRSRAFENLAEGYINCIRILKEDSLKYYVLQYYEDFVRVAVEQDEYQAAASLYREAAEYCLRSGLVYEQYYLRHAGEMWIRTAEKALVDGVPAEMAENSLLAAVECFNAIEDYTNVGATYRRLSLLELSRGRRERYELIARRYDGITARPNAVPGLPDYLKLSHAYPDIWFHDMTEWEQAGSPLTTCAAVVGDRRYPDVVRRRALNILLYILDGGLESTEGRAWIAESLGDLQVYPVLALLERLYEAPDRSVVEPAVQRGVMRALRVLFFKRSFVVLRKGLLSEHGEVKQAAIEALGRLRFTHAFDPLVRIFRESEDADVRGTALRSIGRIPSLEAGDFLIEVLRHEPKPFRELAERSLVNFENREIYSILRQHYQLERGEEARAAMGRILAGRAVVG